MNYIAYRIFEKHSNDLFLWMTMGHFQDHIQEFNEYSRWIRYSSWADIHAMIRELYKPNYSIYGTFYNYIEYTSNSSISSNSSLRWSILLQTMIYSIASSCASSDIEQQTLESSSVQLRKRFIDEARYKYAYYCTRRWFHKIHEIILNNPFQTTTQRETLVNIVCKTYRVYTGLKRLVRIWKWKRSRKNMIMSTLEFEPLESLPKQRILELCQEGSRYAFDCLELRKLWVQGLLSSDNFFSEPKELMNPYTNIKFSKASLWNIYVHLRYHGYTIHETIENYVKCNMNIELFELRYEAMLRNYMIEQHFRELRMLIHKPVAKLSSSEKYKVYDDYKLLLNVIHLMSVHYEPFDCFYYDCMVIYRYDIMQTVLKECITILENYYRKCYSYNVTEKHVNTIQCKENILNYFKDRTNYFRKWYDTEYGVENE